MTSLPRIGIVGGVGWPSTIEYYRAICEGVNRHFAAEGGSPPYPTPPISIDSLDMSRTVRLFGREGETVFLHGARKARVIRLLESTTTACLNVTHVDGLVYARSAFNSSMNYRSATVYGTPRLVEGTDDKLHALKVISESTMPGRWGEVRDSHINEIKKTGVIALDIESASAKLANGMPKDEEEDYAIPIWAGVLPLVSAFTHLQPDQRLLDGVEPSAVVKAMQGKVL